ncbi:MAG: hypothetical protein R3F61_31550 [Myxococcota bacterium]
MWLALSLAFADPPEGVDRDDTDRWEAMTEAALNGPAGCWELAGDVHVNIALLSKASLWRRTSETPFEYAGTWNGTLEDGTWTAFRYRLSDTIKVDGEPIEVPIYPVIGEIDPNVVVSESESPPDAKGSSVTVSSDGSSSPVSLLRSSIEAWDTSTAISIAQWREATREIELIQDTPIKDNPNAPTITMTTRIPEGQWVSRLSAVFPRKLVLGEWPVRLRLHDTQFHLVQRQVADHVFPAAENVSTVGTALGFTVSYEQRLDYSTASPCQSPVDAPEPARPETSDEP